MKSSDWGKLFSRVLSLLLIVGVGQGFGLAITVASSSGRSIPFRFVLPSTIVLAIVLVLAVLLWVFADKFAPVSDDQREEGSERFAVAIVAGVAAYWLFACVTQLQLAWFNPMRANDPVPAHILASLWIYGVMSVVFLVAILNCRRVTEWILR